MVVLRAGLADFGNRGFRVDRPEKRAVLEAHARSFLTGFNLAASARRRVHAALAELPEPERGFGYEGAAMCAALFDVCTARTLGALRHLLDGTGQHYVHLIHVGAGWALAPLRLPWTPLPRTPLLRWLALDGRGFAEVFFGGRRALERHCHRPPTPVALARLAGCGRALWFLESADVAGVAATIAAQPEPARGPLWSGIGLALAYAGAVGTCERAELALASGPHRDHLAQGVAFAVAARVRSGHMPEHTEAASTELLSAPPPQVAAWTDDTAQGLSGRDVTDYLEWKRRLRALLV